ncbi:MAG: MFS transporter [Spirochaetaceae bacterium]|jgi:DHA1 family tetracycline resistance protein-like MFS transporter|nr:MFS transporter [Spirochaetaceae bacterium]
MKLNKINTATIPWLRGMSHNGRVVALSEPFWSIPFNMLTVYAVLYMLELGLTKREIGLTQTVLVGTQIMSSLFSGSLTDHLGRKRTTLIFDLISWSGACLVWAFSGHLGGFLFAAFLNGINKVVYVSFNCMLTEDATSSERLRNYSGLHFMVLTGGFLTPIGGLIVSQFGLIPGARILYLNAAVIMGVMFFIRHMGWKEPQSGKSDIHTGILKGITDSLKYFISDSQRQIVFILQSIAQFYTIFKPLFYYAYLKEIIGLNTAVISLVPVIMSIITMVVLLGFLPRVKNSQRKMLLTAGLAMGSFSLIFLIFSAQGNLILLSIAILIDGISSALLRPLLDSLWADHLSDNKRTRQLAAGNFFFGLVSIPAGSIAAELYRTSPLLPFGAAAAILLFSAVLSLKLSVLSDEKVQLLD